MRSTVLVSLLVIVVAAAVVVQARKHEGGEGKHLHHGKHDHHHHHGKDKYLENGKKEKHPENGKKEKHARTSKTAMDKSKENGQDFEQLRNSVTEDSKKKGKEKPRQEAYQQEQGKYTKPGSMKNKKYKEVKEEPKEGKNEQISLGETEKEGSKETVPPTEAPQGKGKTKTEKQIKQKQGKKPKDEVQKELKVAKEKRKFKLQKPKPTQPDPHVEQPHQAAPTPNQNVTVEESLAENAISGSPTERNNLVCKTNTDCPQGWCCQTKKGSCQEFKTAIGQKCWDGCMCQEGAVCYLEHQSSTTDKGGKGQLGICKTPEPDDLTMGEYLKMQ